MADNESPSHDIYIIQRKPQASCGFHLSLNIKTKQQVSPLIDHLPSHPKNTHLKATKMAITKYTEGLPRPGINFASEPNNQGGSGGSGSSSSGGGGGSSSSSGGGSASGNAQGSSSSSSNSGSSSAAAQSSDSYSASSSSSASKSSKSSGSGSGDWRPRKYEPIPKNPNDPMWPGLGYGCRDEY